MCTFKREPHFARRTVVNLVLDELLRTAQEFDVEIIAYCFMQDHLHVLMAGTAAMSDLNRCARRFRQRAGYAYRRLHQGRLWQEGYFDRTLRDADATIAVVAYVVNNPVIAGYCDTPGDYEFTGSSRFNIDDLVDAIQWSPDSVG